ncbi:hypothetical protein [Nonomuraea coxensis]|uniref:hypothetical protein n=1 Tax=Nonomuraea coxensis TaxID=404386 RepID=UPI0003A81885
MTAVAGRRGTVFRWTRFGVLCLFVVIFLIPIYVLLVTSFKPLTEADPSQAWNLPRTWTVEAWRVAWEKLAPGLWNSVLLAVPGSLLSCALGVHPLPGGDDPAGAAPRRAQRPDRAGRGRDAAGVPVGGAAGVRAGRRGGRHLAVHLAVERLPVHRLPHRADELGQQMAAAILASIPTMVIYVLLGRFFMRGLMAGALRG